MRFWIGAALAFGAMVAIAALVKFEYFFYAGYIVLMYIVLATAWNVLGGYAGYVNFGTPAFFGLGAYTAAVLFKATAAPLALQIAAAAVMSGLLGCLAGLLTLRLRGIFFAIGTIALVVIMETLFINWRYAGGATGLQLLRPAPLLVMEVLRAAVKVVAEWVWVVHAPTISTVLRPREIWAAESSQERRPFPATARRLSWSTK